MRFIIFTLLLGVMSSALYATNITLDEAVSRQIFESPLAARIQAQTKLDFAEPLDSNTLQNPELEFTYDSDKSSELELSQPLRLSDILLERYSYKKSVQQLKSIEERLDLLRIQHQVSQKYYELYAMQQELKFLKEQFRLAERVQQNIQSAMYSDLSSTETVVFETENKALGVQVKRLEKAVASAELTFIQQLNLGDKSVSLKAPPVLFIPKNADVILNQLPNLPTEQRVLQMQTEQAEQRFDIIKKDRWLPTIAPKVGYTFNSDDSSDDWNVGIALSIPLWNQSSGQYDAAKADAWSYRTQMDAMERVSFEELIKKQFDIFKEDHKQLLIYQNEILPSLQNAASKMEQNFLSGAASALDLLQVRDKELSAKKDYLKLLVETNDAKNKLELMIGSRLEDLK